MNYEERERQLYNNCEAKENCSYISRNFKSKCSFKETTMYGWELGYKDAVDKACEYMRNHIDRQLTIYHEQTWKKRDEFIEDFKNYMEVCK